jgi:ComF family protein
MSCWRYSGVGRDIVLALKYRNADFLVNDLAHLIRTNCQEVCSFAANSVLVPVPIHYFRRVKRGYNQAEVIARAVSKIASGSGVVNALTGKNKVSQAGLRRTERLINVKNTFQCSGASGTIAKDARVIVVDDVATTGATARECCRVLRMAGFVDLHVLMLSYGG